MRAVPEGATAGFDLDGTLVDVESAAAQEELTNDKGR